MAIPSDRNGTELHGVVSRAESSGGQQKSQNLRIGPGGPAGQAIQQEKHQQPAEQAVEQVEGGCADTHGEEEEFSFGTENCEWPGQRSVHSVDSSCFWHVLAPSGRWRFSSPEKATKGN